MGDSGERIDLFLVIDQPNPAVVVVSEGNRGLRIRRHLQDERIKAEIGKGGPEEGVVYARGNKPGGVQPDQLV